MSPELVGRGTPRSLVLSQQWEENQPFQLEAQPPVTEAKQAAALGSLYPPPRPPTHPYPPHSCPTGSAGLDRGLKGQTGGEIIFPGIYNPPQKNYLSCTLQVPIPHGTPEDWTGVILPSQYWPEGVLLRGLHKEEGGV